MDVQSVNVTAQEAQPPPGGRAVGKGIPLMGGSTESQAAFQSLMASLMAPLLAAQAPQVTATQPAATGTGQTSALATAAMAAYGAPSTAMTGQTVPTAQTTASQNAQNAQVTAPTTDLMSMIRGAATPVEGKAAVATPVQAPAAQPTPVDNTATLDALRALAAGQPAAAATTEGLATVTTQTSAAATLAAQVFNGEGGEQTEKTTTAKSETGDGQTQFAAPFAANVTATEGAKNAAAVKPANASPVQQIADQVQMTLNRGENSATIRLQPAELGGVRIRMQVQDGQLHLSIEADKSGTGQLIDQQLGNLRQSLENSGMRIGDLAVLAGGRGQTNGVEAMQREAMQSFRTLQMEMGGQQFQQQQQHAQQQAAFAGQDGQQRRQGQFDPAQMLDGGRPAGIGAVNAAGMGGRNVWQTAAYAAVDYYA